MQKVYCFGHRNPDTDSVCSSIALSYLKNKQGMNVVPKILSDINQETKFVLDYFNVDKPEFINDVRIRIKDIKYEKNVYISDNLSIGAAYNKMLKNNITAIPTVNNKLLTGYVTLKEMAMYLISNNKQKINTSFDNVVKELNAEVILKYDEIVTGAVNVVGLHESEFNDSIKLSKDDIIVVGNRPKVINYAIKSGVKFIVLTFGSSIDSKLLSLAEKNNVNVIKSYYDSFNIANKIGLSNYIKSINTTHTPVTLQEDDYYFDFMSQVHKINHTNYPVINKKGECLGLMRLTGPNTYSKKDVILVDHNSFTQSVDGIEEANILEIVDHHNLGAIGTTSPIDFRCMTVGSTATIIFKMYEESKVKIPKDIAGLLLSAIISDTLLYTSPTTTEIDKVVAKKLAKLAKVNDVKYAKEMFKAASNIDGMSIKEMVYSDYKSYDVGKKKIGISVITTMDFDGMKPKIDEIVSYLNLKIDNGYDLSVMFVTDIINGGSYIIYNDSSVKVIEESFNLKDIYQGIFVKDLISRKKQMLPNILETLSGIK